MVDNGGADVADGDSGDGGVVVSSPSKHPTCPAGTQQMFSLSSTKTRGVEASGGEHLHSVKYNPFGPLMGVSLQYSGVNCESLLLPDDPNVISPPIKPVTLYNSAFGKENNLVECLGAPVQDSIGRFVWMQS